MRHLKGERNRRRFQVAVLLPTTSGLARLAAWSPDLARTRRPSGGRSPLRSGNGADRATGRATPRSRLPPAPGAIGSPRTGSSASSARTSLFNAGRAATGLLVSTGRTRRRATPALTSGPPVRDACFPGRRSRGAAMIGASLALAFAQKEQPHDGAGRARSWCEPITAAGVVAAGVHSSARAGSAGAARWRLAMCFDSTVTLSRDTSSRMIDRPSSYNPPPSADAEV